MPIRSAFVFCLLAATQASAQTRLPAFEAAAIRPSKTNDGHSGWHTRPGYLVLQSQTVQGIVGIAYDVPMDRVLGGPKWIDGERFDIEARSNDPAGDPELRLMLQSLLAERFQLVTHRETKVFSGYALVPLKSGLKIHADPSTGGASTNSSHGKLNAQRVTFAKLAEILTRVLRTPVVDATGIEDRFSFTLEWSTEQSDAAGGPDIYTALPQQLGVKLESKKVSAEVVVIDQANKPSEN